MNDSTTKSSAEREAPERAAADDGMIERGPHAGELDGDLDEQGRAMAAADEAGVPPAVAADRLAEHRIAAVGRLGTIYLSGR